MKTVLSILFILLIAGSVLVIVSDKGDSGRKIAWLLIITVLPVIGIILYLLVGLNYRHHWIYNMRYRKYLDYLHENMTPELHALLFEGSPEKLPQDWRALSEMMQRTSKVPVTSGNDVEIITNGHRKFNALMRDLERAQQSIHIEYFHFGNDSGGKAIRDMLMKKASEGVEVRFIHENIANFPIMPGYYNQMKKSGVQVQKFTNPRAHIINLVTALNYRNHRKIVVIDGKVGYTGGMNANNHYFLTWRDTHMRITGKAVASLQLVFLSSWITGKGSLSRPLLSYFPQAGLSDAEAAALSLGDAPTPYADRAISEIIRCDVPYVATEDAICGRMDIMARHQVLKDKMIQIVPDETDAMWPSIRMSYEWVIQHAKKYIWLQTPYFVPPDPVLSAMKVAAMSGVDVRLMVPEKADNILVRPVNESYYAECLEAGVKIYLRKGEFCHAKTFVCDDYLSSIGTANMDFRSFELNFEDNGYIFDRETALFNKALYLKDIEQCTELNPRTWERRPLRKRFIQSLMQLFAPLL